VTGDGEPCGNGASDSSGPDHGNAHGQTLRGARGSSAT
jgi:hypothetical protein